MKRAKSFPMASAPIDRDILVCIDGEWIQAKWYIAYEGAAGEWSVVNMSSHGCGCCSYKNDSPTAWAELPQG